MADLSLPASGPMESLSRAQQLVEARAMSGNSSHVLVGFVIQACANLSAMPASARAMGLRTPTGRCWESTRFRASQVWNQASDMQCMKPQDIVWGSAPQPQIVQVRNHG